MRPFTMPVINATGYVVSPEISLSKKNQRPYNLFRTLIISRFLKLKLAMKNKLINSPEAGKKALLLIFLIAAFAACRTAEIPVTDDLKSGTTMFAVKGRQGFQIGQVLSFGEYQTSKINRGWTKGYSIPFVVHFKGASEKLSYEQFGPNGRSAKIALAGRFRETELSPLRDYFAISVKNKNVFTGGIELNGSKESWEFIIQNVDGWDNSLKNNTMGLIRSKADYLQIDIIGIRELGGVSKMMTMMDVSGYEFWLDGKVIGAVSTLNNGKVWMKDNIHPELKLVLASVSSGLMLRNNVLKASDDVALGS